MLSATSIANYIDCKVHFYELAATYAMWKYNGLDSFAREWRWRAMEHASYVRLYPGTIVPACTHFNASRLLVESHGVRCSIIMCQKSASCHTPGQKWREDNAGNFVIHLCIHLHVPMLAEIAALFGWESPFKKSLVPNRTHVPS